MNDVLFLIFVPILGIGMSLLLFFIFYYQHRNFLLIQKSLDQEKFSVIGELSAKISHELRNPLSIIHGVTLLNKEKPPKDSDEANKRNKMLSDAVSRMTNQLDQILDFVRKSPLKKTEFELSELISNVISTMNIPSNIKITVSPGTFPIIADKLKIESVFTNLFQNSIHAINGSGQIDVKISESDLQYYIKVIDSGVSPSKQDLANIFDPLFTTKLHGTGLGLAICKNIITHHGGDISASTLPTMFTITLPKK